MRPLACAPWSALACAAAAAAAAAAARPQRAALPRHLDEWRFAGRPSPGADGAAEGAAAASPPAERNETYRDAIGCCVPGQVGGVRLVPLPLGWGASQRGLPLAEAGARGVTRRARSRRWRCRPLDGPLLFDAALLQSAATLAGYASPGRRLRYEDWAAGRGGDAGEGALRMEPFGADHRVFGSYGGLWALLGLAAASAPRLCPSGSLCGICSHLAQTLAEVESWVRRAPEKQLDILHGVLDLLSPHGGAERWGRWRSCLLRGLADLAAAQRPGAPPRRSHEEALQRALAVTGGAAGAGAAAELAALGAAGGAAVPRPAPDGAGPRWRLCGPPGEVSRQDLLGGNLHATILGVWGFADHHGPDSAGAPGWDVEVALFVGVGGGCVYVDGQRLFQTHPLSYLTSWACTVTDPRGYQATSVRQGVVSYSGTVALVWCHFGDRPPAGPLELSLHALSGGLALEAVPVCPWRPPGWPAYPQAAVAASAAGAPRPQSRPQHGAVSPYARGVTVCSEVLYGLDTAYRAGLVQQWLEYHRILGVDHFVLYDRDGSLGTSAVLEPYLLSGFVTYFPRFPEWALSPEHGLLHGVHGLPSHAAPDAQAAAHCLFSQRGLSEWVAFIHSPDEYLSSAGGLRDIRAEVLDQLRPLRAQGLGAVDVPALYFCREPGEAMRESPWLLGRYVRRATSPIELRRWGSGVAGFLNRFGSPLVDPRRVGDLVSAHYPRGQVGTLYLDDVPQSFLRVNHYGEAFAFRTVLEAGDPGVRDESALWFEEVFERLGLPPLPPGPEPPRPASAS